MIKTGNTVTEKQLTSLADKKKRDKGEKCHFLHLNLHNYRKLYFLNFRFSILIYKYSELKKIFLRENNRKKKTF